MANVTPMQLIVKSDNPQIVYADDQKLDRKNRSDILKEILGDRVIEFTYREGQKFNTGYYINSNNEHVYFILVNITFMGGTEGQHPKDLKRIQYNLRWREFYNEYSTKGKVIWLGLYSFNDTKIWASFKPETYLAKHNGKSMLTKSGLISSYSCHIFLNDLFQGYVTGEFLKKDKNGNFISTFKYENLSFAFEDKKHSTDPVVDAIKIINNECIMWNKWISADKAIPYMRNVKVKTGFNQWKQNLWNGWLVEAIYSDYLYENHSQFIDYIATSQDENVINEYKKLGLDLAFPEENNHFIGDLKAVCLGDGDTLLNDEQKVEEALRKYKRIWFVMYLHDKLQGKTNNYEMVKWRNNYIYNMGEWPKNKPFDELSAPLTPHSISFTEMIIIELNEITKYKYFKIGKQFGLNSDGSIRNDKYKVNKKLIESINDDSFVVYRYKPEKEILPSNKNFFFFLFE